VESPDATNRSTERALLLWFPSRKGTGEGQTLRKSVISPDQVSTGLVELTKSLHSSLEWFQRGI